VYIPLGGNRVSRGRFALNLLTVWALTGLWHGASWNFVLWGLYYGVLLLAEKLVIGKRLERVPTALRRLVTFVLVTLGWVLFNLSDSRVLFPVLRRMFVFAPSDWRALLALDASVCSKLLMILPALLLCFPFPKKWMLREDSAAASLAVNALYAALLVLCVLFTISSSFTPFIYFNF
jgi:alginate O-acetyltransferase complex protein AlgI